MTQQSGFGGPYVNLPLALPGSPVTPPTNPLAPQPTPDLNAFFSRMHTPLPGSQFLKAVQHPGAAPAPHPNAPTQGHASVANAPQLDMYGNAIESAAQAVKDSAAASDAAFQSLYSFQPDTPAPAPYTPPAPEQANVGRTLGHALVSLISPRVGAFAQRAATEDAATRKEHDALNQRNAELQYQAAEADAQRREHYTEVDLTKRTALADAAEKQHETAISNYSKTIDNAQKSHIAQQRAQTYADNIASQIDTRHVTAAQRDAVIQETAKRDADNFGLKNKQVAVGIWRTNLQEFDKLKEAGIRSDTALNVASQHSRIGLIEQEMRDNAGVLKETMHEKYGSYLAQVTAMKGQMSQIIAAASLPGASPEVTKQAQELFQKGGLADQLAQKIQAESGGAIAAPDTSIQQKLASEYDAGMAESATSPGTYGDGSAHVTVNNYEPSRQPGAQPQAPAGGGSPPYPGAAPAGFAPNGAPAGGNNDIYTRYGLTAPGGTPQHAAPVSAPAAVAPHSVAAPDQRLVAQARQAISYAKTHNQDPAITINAFAKMTGMTPEAAAAAIGVHAPGAAPQPQQRPPAAPAPPQQPPVGVPGGFGAGPISQIPAPPGARPPVSGQYQPPGQQPQHAAAPKPAAPAQAPAQFALDTVRAANDHDSAQGTTTPLPQQIQILTKALMQKYPGLSQQNAEKVASGAVNAASGDLGGNAMRAAAGALGGVARTVGNIAAAHGPISQSFNDTPAPSSNPLSPTYGAGGSNAAGGPW